MRARLAIAFVMSVLAASSALAQGQPPGDSWSAAVADVRNPGWYQRAGEGAFSWRDPRSGFYIVLGGHAGISRNTRLESTSDCGSATNFFLSCATVTPSDDLGTGGGGSFGVGTRLTPALRIALIATAEGGYRFDNATPWVDPSNSEAFNERFSVRSYQGSLNIYLDGAGLFTPGALGRFNPYVMAGVGIAHNVAGDVRELDNLGGGIVVTNTYPGGAHTSFLWTAGGGVQYQIATGLVADLSYQYVDAGRFRAAVGGPQINGLTGQPFEGNFQFDAIQGDLRTHRIGFAVNIELGALGRLVAGR